MGIVQDINAENVFEMYIFDPNDSVLDRMVSSSVNSYAFNLNAHQN